MVIWGHSLLYPNNYRVRGLNYCIIELSSDAHYSVTTVPGKREDGVVIIIICQALAFLSHTICWISEGCDIACVSSVICDCSRPGACVCIAKSDLTRASSRGVFYGIVNIAVATIELLASHMVACWCSQLKIAFDHDTTFVAPPRFPCGNVSINLRIGFIDYKCFHPTIGCRNLSCKPSSCVSSILGAIASWPCHTGAIEVDAF